MTRRKSGVLCPAGCGSRDSRVLDSGGEADGTAIRIRKCSRCLVVFRTREREEGVTSKRYARQLSTG